jgi:hypothetical protein
MNKRSFLASASALGLSAWLPACADQRSHGAVYLLSRLPRHPQESTRRSCCQLPARSLQLGDSLAVARAAQLQRKDIIAKATFDNRPCRRARRRVPHRWRTYLSGERQRLHRHHRRPDQRALFLNETGAGKRHLISPTWEGSDNDPARLLIDLKNIRVVAVNVVQPKIDNVDPALPGPAGRLAKARGGRGRDGVARDQRPRTPRPDAEELAGRTKMRGP